MSTLGLVNFVLSTFFVIIMVSVAGYDALLRRVPNKVLLCALGLQCLSLLLSAPLQGVVREWTPALAGFALALIVFFPLWRFGAMGAGDVKFLAVLGFALGPLGLFWSWLLASVMAGIHAVAVIVIGNLNGSPLGEWFKLRTHRVSAAVWRRLAPLWAWILARRNGRRGTPYATYLAAGALIWVFYLYGQ